MTPSAKRLLLALGVLVCVTTAAMVWDHWTWQHRKTPELARLQTALGGLGLGAIASPIWNFVNYDPRVMAVDDSITWPVPGGYSYGPDRTATITYFEETPRNQWSLVP